MIKKEQVMGREVKLELGFIQALQNFFNAKPTEAKTIRWGTPEFRKYKTQLKTKKEVWKEVERPKEKVR